jgi:hypothetical protein
MLPLNNEYDKVVAKFEKSYQSNEVYISSIFKITNNKLTQMFEEQFLDIKRKREFAPEIIEVYHGTTLEAAKNIIHTGFDPSYSKIAAFGRGTYASPNIKLALQYCKDAHISGKTSMVFLCRFLKGVYGSHQHGIIDTNNYDHSGDKYAIYVTPYAGGIIPDYLICYYGYDVATPKRKLK